MNKIKVCIFSRDKFRYLGICGSLAGNEEFLVPDTRDLPDETAFIAEFLPDVLILDVLTGWTHLGRFVRHCKQVSPQTKILTTGIMSDKELLEALHAGIRGHLDCPNAPDLLMEAIRVVHRGNAWVSRQTMSHFIDDVASAGTEPSSRSQKRLGLTEIQKKVLQLLASEGATNREIAAQLGVKERTIEFHVSRLLRKFRLSSRERLVIYALRNNLVPLESIRV